MRQLKHVMDIWTYVAALLGKVVEQAIEQDPPSAITVIVSRSFGHEGISSDSKEPTGHIIWQQRLQLGPRPDVEEEGKKGGT
jgi:hypothetical protein